MYFFTIDAYSMTLSSKIRYDSLAGTTTRGRMAFYEKLTSGYRQYFTYVRNVPSFSSASSNEILVNRKALMYSNDNKFDCKPSDVFAEVDTDFTITGTDVSLSTLPTADILLILNPVATPRILFLADIVAGTPSTYWMIPNI